MSEGGAVGSRAASIIQVSRFIDPDWLLEIEADAVVDDDGGLTYG